MNSPQTVIGLSVLVGALIAVGSYILPTWMQTTSCNATRAIQPLRALSWHVESDDRGSYWVIDMEHIGSDATPIYIYTNTQPSSVPRGAIYKLTKGESVRLNSRHSKPGNQMSFAYGEAYSYLTNTEKYQSNPPDVLYPLGADGTYIVMQSAHGTDGKSLKHSSSHTHAVDIRAPKGTPVHAGVDGVVAFIEDRFPDSKCGNPDVADHGNRVVIRSPEGFDVTYAHLENGSVMVSLGDSVRRGEVVGRVGASGAAYTHHLHIELGGITDHGYTTIPFKLVDFEGVSVAMNPGSTFSHGRQ